MPRTQKQIEYFDKWVLERYAYYYEVIQKLGKAGPFVTLKELEPSRGVVQRAYKEMRYLGFDGKFQHYMEWISMLFLLFLIRKNGYYNDDLMKSFLKMLAIAFPQDARNFRMVSEGRKVRIIRDLFQITFEEAERLNNIFKKFLH